MPKPLRRRVSMADLNHMVRAGATVQPTPQSMDLRRAAAETDDPALPAVGDRSMSEAELLERTQARSTFRPDDVGAVVDGALPWPRETLTAAEERILMYVKAALREAGPWVRLDDSAETHVANYRAPEDTDDA